MELVVTSDFARRRFAEVVLPHLDDAYGLARWLTGSGTDAEDVVQEACLRALASLEAATIERQPLWNNRKSDQGPFDVIGDVHGCFDELETLLADPTVKDAWAQDVAGLARRGVGRHPFAMDGALVAVVDVPRAIERVPLGAAIVVPCELDGERVLALMATGTSEVVLDSNSRREPAWVSFRFDRVEIDDLEVRDVAAGLILTMERGQIGHRYILGGESVSLKKILKLMATISGRRHLSIPVSGRVAEAAAAMLEFISDHITHRPPSGTAEGVRIALRASELSIEKSRSELGYTPRPIEPTLRETIAYLLGAPEAS